MPSSPSWSAFGLIRPTWFFVARRPCPRWPKVGAKTTRAKLPSTQSPGIGFGKRLAWRKDVDAQTLVKFGVPLGVRLDIILWISGLRLFGASIHNFPICQGRVTGLCRPRTDGRHGKRGHKQDCEQLHTAPP